MKKSFLLFVLLGTAVTGLAQTAPSGSISRKAADNSTITSDTNTVTTSESAAAGLTFTNKEGQTFAVQKLAEDLRTLRSTIEETLPMLIAFNETFSNSAATDKTLTGKLSGLLSGALNRNQGTNTASDQSSGKYAGVVNALQGLLSKGKDGTSAPAISADTIKELEALQTQLQPVASTLQNLKVNIDGLGTNSVNSSEGLTPTGRSGKNRSPSQQ